MKLELEDGTKTEIADAALLDPFLRSLTPIGNGFAILSRSDQNFIQTALTDDGYIIEKCLGGADAFFRAAHLVSKPVEISPKPWWKFWSAAPAADCFTIDDVVRFFRAYAGDGLEPSDIVWQEASF